MVLAPLTTLMIRMSRITTAATRATTAGQIRDLSAGRNAPSPSTTAATMARRRVSTPSLPSSPLNSRVYPRKLALTQVPQDPIRASSAPTSPT